MTTSTNGAWLPLADAASALGCSVDTVRRRIKRGDIDSKMDGPRYMVHVEVDRPPVSQALTVVEDLHPSVKAMLDYVRERDVQRDREVAQLREDLARARADLVMAQSALPPANGKPWGPFAWFRQLWAAQASA